MTERVLVTGAGRDTGRLLALAFAARGAHVFVQARTAAAAEETVALIARDGVGSAEALVGELADVAEMLAARTERLDLLVNSAARYLQAEASAADLADALHSASQTVLLTERVLGLLRKSPRPDIVNLISSVAEPGHDRCEAHAAFYAAKHAHAGHAAILSRRLRPEGIRVISLFPPDFVQDGPRAAGAQLTAASVVETVLFAVNQPRDNFIRAIHFEQCETDRE